MNRTAYHRAYYYAHLDRRRASARASRRKAREWQAVIRIVCEAVTEARNDKPPFGGLTLPGGWHYAEVAVRRTCSLVLLMDLSTYLYASAHLVGETTRRQGLNLDRGGQPLDTQRIAGKREWHRETGKCSPQRMAPSVITPHDPIEAFLRLNRADSPSVIGSV